MDPGPSCRFHKRSPKPGDCKTLFGELPPPRAWLVPLCMLVFRGLRPKSVRHCVVAVRNTRIGCLVDGSRADGVNIVHMYKHVGNFTPHPSRKVLTFNIASRSIRFFPSGLACSSIRAYGAYRVLLVHSLIPPMLNCNLLRSSSESSFTSEMFSI